MRARASILAVLAAISLNCAAQSIVTRKSHVKPFTPQQVFAPYWTLEPGWATHFELRNNRPDRNLDVDVTLTTANGNEASLGTVTVNPQEVLEFDLADLIKATRPELLTAPIQYGSAKFTFSGQHYANMYIATVVHRIGFPISFHFDAVVNAPGYAGSSAESIWWLPKSTADGYVIVSNVGAQAASVRLNAWGSSGARSLQKTLVVEAKNTARLKFRDLLQGLAGSDAFGGLQVSVDGDASAVHVSEVAFDETARFSALLKTFRRDPSGEAGPQSVRAPIVALSQPDPTLGLPTGTRLKPMVFLRNTLGTPVSPALTVSWHSASANGQFAKTIETLAPFETRAIDLSTFQQAGFIAADAIWSTVSLSYSGRDHDIVAVEASYDDAGRFGVQSPFTDILSGNGVGSQWKVDGAHNSLFTVGNAGAKTARVAVTLFYNKGRGRYEMPEQEVASGSQVWVDVGKIIQTRIPDKNGNTVPLDVSSGTYTIEDLADPAMGYLFEAKVITDKTFGHATYGCWECCAIDDATWMEADPTALNPGDNAGLHTKGTNTCTGQEQELTGYSSNWTSNDAAIAGATFAGVTGVSVGDTYINAFTSHRPNERRSLL